MSSYFSERQTRSMKTLSIQRPRPSIEMRTPASMSAPVKAAAVNWLTIGVENLRLAVSGQCFFQRSEAERGVHRVGEPPGENGPARPVDDRDQIEEAPADRDVRVSRPKEFHLRPLSEPDVNLSAHPAPVIHPTTGNPSANGRMRVAGVAPAVWGASRLSETSGCGK